MIKIKKIWKEQKCGNGTEKKIPRLNERKKNGKKMEETPYDQKEEKVTSFRKHFQRRRERWLIMLVQESDWHASVGRTYDHHWRSPCKYPTEAAEIDL